MTWGLTEGHRQDNRYLKTAELQCRLIGVIEIYPVLTGAPHLSAGTSARGTGEAIAHWPQLA